MSIVLSAINISKTFPNRLSVLNPTSFNIKKGEKYVIKGKSGSGKSTLLNILAGFEKPSSGKVLYKNRSLHEMNDNEQSHIRGVSFGFIFQSFHLIPELSVKENIELPLMFNENEHALRAEELAKELEIYHLLGKRPFLLSGGEQQRVAIARALITLPEVIFADEPTGNLDETTAERVIDLLCRLCNNYGLNLVLATHENCLINNPHFLCTIFNGDIEVKYTNV